MAQQTLTGKTVRTDDDDNYGPTHGYGRILELHNPETDFATVARRINRVHAEGYITKNGRQA